MTWRKPIQRLQLPVLLLTAVLATAGCGGASSTPGRTTSMGLARNDPAATLERFAEAARDRDAGAVWQLLSRRTRAELGPTLACFRRHAAGVERRAGAFTIADGYATTLSEPLGGGVAVAAVVRSARRGVSGPDTHAAALRFERGAWRVELGGPVRLRALLPVPEGTTRTPLPQLALEIRSRTPIAEGGLWLDGVAFSAEIGGVNPHWLTIWGRTGLPLEPGQHFVVGFARAGDNMAALAWSFVVR